MVRYNKKKTPKYDDGNMDIVEQSALLVALLGNAFLIYLFFDMFTEIVWWIRVGLSVSITTALYYFIKYVVDWLHEV
tara:strand:- start:163 stop:393 length:231 start_codon:yes stop_codon:yes gene_type:complete